MTSTCMGQWGKWLINDFGEFVIYNENVKIRTLKFYKHFYLSLRIILLQKYWYIFTKKSLEGKQKANSFSPSQEIQYFSG